MHLWRISRHTDLDGIGGLRASGRWHRAGLRIVYTAQSPAGALLETCVHTAAGSVPALYTLLRIARSGLPLADISDSELPANRRTNLDATQAIGNRWLTSLSSPLLRVPSALAPETWNVLINPAHPDAYRLVIEQVYHYPFDDRLKQ
jgi:RES domain-containing protein